MAEENNTPKTEQEVRDTHRMVFYALLEAAMRYRESFYREDCEAYEKGLMESFDMIQEERKFSFSVFKKNDAKMRAMILENKARNERFNKMVYGTIENLDKALSADNRVRFDNYSTSYGLVAEELAKAKNTTEFITVCNLYNSGYFADHFAQIKEKELNNQYEIKNHEHKTNETIVDGDHLRAGTNQLPQE